MYTINMTHESQYVGIIPYNVCDALWQQVAVVLRSNVDEIVIPQFKKVHVAFALRP